LEHGLPIITTRPIESPKSKVQSPKSTIQNPKSKIQNQRWPALFDSENALLVTPGDVAGLVEMVERLANDGELSARRAAGGRQLKGQFSWERIAEMHEQLYEELGVGKDSPHMVS